MCQVLEVSRSAYYAWRRRPKSQREHENDRILGQIKDIYRESRCLYGSPRITAELRDRGIVCNHKRISRLMRVNHIQAKTKKKFRIKTSKHDFPVFPNILKQEFQASEPNRIWTSDITYIRTDQGWLYLAVILDLFSRIVVGWAMDAHIDHFLVLHAIMQALGRRNLLAGCIFHSDRGSQYACKETSTFLKEHQFIQSMSGKGNCYDNAVTETFFGTLKSELIQFNHYQTRTEAKQSVFEYLEIYYNRIRRHSTLGYMSPVDYEKSKIITLSGVHFRG